MSRLPPELSGLTPREKRALLASLLRQRVREAAAGRSTDERRTSVLDQFITPVTDLSAEVDLDPAVRPDSVPVAHHGEPTSILLTGATVFLGAFLLSELLQRTRATIHCLVRCTDVEQGRRRIEHSLATYVPGCPHPRARIVPVVGDLSEPLLGLSPDRFGALATQVDSIYHNAAVVNWIGAYRRLKPANVGGTSEILRLASQGRVKPVHVVSSLAVFPLAGNPRGTIVREQDSLDHGGALYGGYTQSKWVAEKLVAVARDRGLPVAVYRPGIIAGHSETGAWNADDFMSRLLKSWIELGTAPDLDGAIDLTPVDYVSRAMVHLSLSQQAPGGVFHLVNPRPTRLDDLVAWIRCFGYPVELLPYDQWRTALLSRARRSKGHAAHQLAPLFSATPEDSSRREDHRTPDGRNTLDRIGSIMAAEYAARSVTFDDRRTREGLAGTSIACPQLDGDVFARYLSHFVRSGFLPAPTPSDPRTRAGTPD